MGRCHANSTAVAAVVDAGITSTRAVDNARTITEHVFTGTSGVVVVIVIVVEIDIIVVKVIAVDMVIITILKIIIAS